MMKITIHKKLICSICQSVNIKHFEMRSQQRLAKLKGEWQEEHNDSLLLGSYVHAWLEGAPISLKRRLLLSLQEVENFTLNIKMQI